MSLLLCVARRCWPRRMHCTSSIRLEICPLHMTSENEHLRSLLATRITRTGHVALHNETSEADKREGQVDRRWCKWLSCICRSPALLSELGPSPFSFHNSHTSDAGATTFGFAALNRLYAQSYHQYQGYSETCNLSHVRPPIQWHGG